MKLYDVEISGNCYKARLMAALLGLPLELVPVDMKAGENRTPAYLAMNPRGQVPVLDDDGHVFWDSTAILIYLARKHGGEGWLPCDAEGLAQVGQWLAFAQNEVLYGLARARAVKLLNRPFNLADCQALGAKGLEVLQTHLLTRDWLVLNRPTVADVAVFPYVALAYQGGLDLDAYPAVQAWIARVKALPGYVGMPGL